jgi:hypothetical protein
MALSENESYPAVVLGIDLGPTLVTRKSTTKTRQKLPPLRDSLPIHGINPVAGTIRI